MSDKANISEKCVTGSDAAYSGGPGQLTGLGTLYVKEVMRFLKVPVQTLFGPVMTATLFMMVFAVAVGERIELAILIILSSFLPPALL